MRASRALRRSGRLGAPTAETIRALSPPMCGRGASATPATRASTGKRIRPATAGSAPRPAGPAPTKKVKAAVGRTIEQGVDEAGRGPLAGPVVAAAVVLPADACIKGIDDSKKLTADQREVVYEALMAHPGVSVSACVVGEAVIDDINILQATMRAMAGAVAGLDAHGGPPDYVLVDGNRVPEELDAATSRAVVGGDAKCLSIAAASVVAKVTRDRLVVALDAKYPQYGFAQHKGYGTAAHVAALRQHGPCPVHRRTFAPVKDMV